MLRKSIFGVQRNSNLQLRGESPSRLDNLSDAIFGLAITLLIVTPNSPNSFSDLTDYLKMLLPMGISILVLMMVWYEHSRFTLLFGLSDARTVGLNAVFLFIVLFYVYPLRYLTLVMSNIYARVGIEVNMQPEDMPRLMIFYGLGYGGLFFVLLLMYRRALAKKEELGLSPYEVFYTRMTIWKCAVSVFVPVLSAMIAWLIQHKSIGLASGLAGFTYFLFMPLMSWWSRKFKKQEQLFADAV